MSTQDKYPSHIPSAGQISTQVCQFAKAKQLPNTSTHQLTNPSTHRLKKKRQPINLSAHKLTSSKLINLETHQLKNLKLLFLFYNAALIFTPF